MLVCLQERMEKEMQLSETSGLTDLWSQESLKLLTLSVY